jgi:DNA-binding transcriptional ArsR family regulator
MAGAKDSGKRGDMEKHYRCAAFVHPLRNRILRLMSNRQEVGVGEIAVELDQTPGTIAYHLRVLVKRDALKIVPRCRPTPPLYRWSPAAEWARKKLDEIDRRDSEED